MPADLNIQKALELILNYRRGSVTEAEYQSALQYITVTPGVWERIEKLSQTLLKPGGIDCAEAQQRMLVALEGTSNDPLSVQEETELKEHLMVCQECEEALQEIAVMLTLDSAGEWPQTTDHQDDLKIPRFKIPHHKFNS